MESNNEYSVEYDVNHFYPGRIILYMLYIIIKGIIWPFKLKEIYHFYYFIDAGEFFYSNDTH